MPALKRSLINFQWQFLPHAQVDLYAADSCFSAYLDLQWRTNNKGGSGPHCFCMKFNTHWQFIFVNLHWLSDCKFEQNGGTTAGSQRRELLERDVSAKSLDHVEEILPSMKNNFAAILRNRTDTELTPNPHRQSTHGQCMNAGQRTQEADPGFGRLGQGRPWVNFCKIVHNKMNTLVQGCRSTEACLGGGVREAPPPWVRPGAVAQTQIRCILPNRNCSPASGLELQSKPKPKLAWNAVNLGGASIGSNSRMDLDF